MTIHSLDDLFIHELQETYAAEQFVQSSFADVAAADGYVRRASKRIQRLERMLALMQGAPSAGQRPAFADALEGIKKLAAVIEDGTAREAAILSALQLARHYFLARYAALASWATQIDKLELSEVLMDTLREERLEIFEAESVGKSAPAEKDPKSLTIGERLTAMFDRKR